MWPFTKKISAKEFTPKIKHEISELEDKLRKADAKSLPEVVARYATRVSELEKEGYNTQFPKYVIDCYRTRLERGKK